NRICGRGGPADRPRSCSAPFRLGRCSRASICPSVSVRPLATGSLFGAPLFVLVLKFLQIAFQPIEALVPEAAIVFHPVSDILEGSCLQSARPPLRLAAARNETRSLQHLEMLGNRGKT